VLAVVGLGRHTFLPHTHQKTSILFAIKHQADESIDYTRPIFFAISERDGKNSKGQPIIREGAPTGGRHGTDGTMIWPISCTVTRTTSEAPEKRHGVLHNKAD